MEPRFNELLHNEVLGITNDIPQLDLLKCMEQNLDKTNQLPKVPWQFVESRFHCNEMEHQCDFSNLR